MSTLGKVAVLMGGSSAEREVSLRSGAAVLAALQSLNVDAFGFDPKEHSLLELPVTGAQRVFNVLHGGAGEDGRVQAILESLGLPYTGSGVLACALSMDKGRTKALWRGMQLPTAASMSVQKKQLAALDPEQLLAELGGKVMVKPAHEGSSIGMGKAESGEELASALQQAAEFDDEILVEAWLAGPEYTVAILGDEALPVIRVKTPHDFYDYAAKYQDNTTEYLCPAGLTEQREKEVRQLALTAFRATGAKGWGRIDLMEDAEGNLQLLELNTAPGMTEKSLVPMAAKQHGLTFPQLVERVLGYTLG
ncbi:D-alanine--D-alanine ligase [Aliidiomarina halalkaliphila]|uniref:D-alanine--D-alanine ligase n=1 Tax=Aliidiomarina halalkaliphila TaxID=2593535 RepID=A0A552X5Y2_9GAMM|nr:D-alanine--D-alanine ligase [Aliidiomarina halalkaliphila]TRW50406.1 D-alanine--D-alanine ligase [Aliidiomarina halalkaliphila]